MAKHNITHGYYGTPLYNAWVHMKARCAHHSRYQDVNVDPRWVTFEGFLQFPPAGQFSEGMHLTRRDDVGPYSPENCRWRTAAENAREAIERRMIRLPDGRFANDVAREHGIRTDTWHARVRRGWSIERAVGLSYSSSDDPSDIGVTVPHRQDGPHLSTWRSTNATNQD